MDTIRTAKLLEFHEDKKTHVYKDSLGYWSIGIGRCVHPGRGPGLRESEIQFMFENDMDEYLKEFAKYLPWFFELSDVRQAVLLDMRHNLGLTGLLTFRMTLKFVANGAYAAAAEQMLKSKWARQVGEGYLSYSIRGLLRRYPQRALMLSQMMQSNSWPEILET